MQVQELIPSLHFALWADTILCQGRLWLCRDPSIKNPGNHLFSFFNWNPSTSQAPQLYMKHRHQASCHSIFLLLLRLFNVSFTAFSILHRFASLSSESELLRLVYSCSFWSVSMLSVLQLTGKRATLPNIASKGECFVDSWRGIVGIHQLS